MTRISSRLLGRILAAVSRLDEFASPEPGLREISSLLDDIPGISGAAFEIDTVIDFSADPFNDTDEDSAEAAAEAAIDDRAIGGLRLITGSGAENDERNPAIPLRAGRTLYGWLRLHHAAGAPPRRLATELEAIGRLVALHLEKRQTIALLERANTDMAEAHLTLECDLHCLTVENAVLAAIAKSQGRALRGMAPDLALAPLLDTLKNVTRTRHVGIFQGEPGAGGRIVFDPPR